MNTNIKLVLFTLVICLTGMSAQPVERLPLVREGAKWVHTEYYECTYPDTDWQPQVIMGRLYRYEMRGDTVIDGTAYTKCYRISMSRNTLWGTMGHEMQRGLSCSASTPVACMRQEGRTVYYRLPGGRELKLYDFEGSDVLPNYRVEMTSGLPVEVAGCECEVYFVHDYSCRIIEGIGSVSEMEGELLFPVFDYPLGLEYSFHGLAYVEDADGDVIFMGPNYGMYDDETDLRGDLDGNGVVDVDDLNAAINEVFRYNKIVDNTTFGEDEEYFYVVPFKRAADHNNDGYVDIADVNAVVNRMVHKY